MRASWGGLWLLAFAVLAVDCKSGSLGIGNPVRTHRGGIVTVSCGRDVGTCYDRAAGACPYGYDPIDASTDTTVIVNSTAAGNSVQTHAIPVHHGQLVVKCRKALLCEHAQCGPDFECVESVRYAGRRVCALK
jgi:hypothetical protein